MFNVFEPNVKATIAFLRLLKVPVNNETVNETLQNHPDWPSVLCVSDGLNKWDVPNGVGKIEPEKIAEIPTPFIAFTRNKETPMAIVGKVDNNGILKFQKSYRKPEIVSKEDFFRTWDGTFLFAETNEHSGEPGYDTIRRNSFFKALVPLAALSLILGICFWLLRSHIVSSGIEGTAIITGIYVQFLLTLAGAGVSVILLWYEIDQNNILLHKVCTGIIKGNCGAILTGKASEVFSWLSWSEVGFFYFAGALLSFVLAGNQLLNYVSLIALFNMLAVVYPFYSVYYQWRVAKEWCIFCLTVQGLLVLGAVTVFSFNLLSFKLLTIAFLLQSLFLYMLPVLAWYAVKPFILRLQEAKFIKREHLRLKFNTEVFDTLLKKQKQISVPVDGLGIDIGKADAKHLLIKVCNPYCGPCAKAHPKIEKLISENPDLIKAKIIFTATMYEKDYRTEVVKHLLAVASKNDAELTTKALDDWYLADKKNYKTFAAKYPLNGEIEKQTASIVRMEKWCDDMKVTATPTIFINGYQFPDVYDIGDLEYFLLE